MNNGTRGLESFEVIYETVFPLLFRIAYHITGSQHVAEEMCQEAFIKYFNRTSPLPSVADVKFWLIRVVKNLCYNFEKRKGREQKAYRTLYNIPDNPPETGESITLRHETERLVQDALQRIPYKLRTVLVMKEYSDMSYKQIGKVLGISEGNVKVRVFRARQHLEKVLIKEDLHVSQ